MDDLADTGIGHALQDAYPDARCELLARDAWELLVAAILSARTTDVQVNKVMAVLNEHYVGPQSFADLDHRELDRVIRHVPLHRQKARAIVEARSRTPFQRTVPLADLIARCQGGPSGRIHPATRCFQALRRAVNEEGEELRHGLSIAERLLSDGGRLAVITFHSLEDGFVRKVLQERAREGHWLLGSKKPLGPGAAERRANPRARSALLRWATRTHAPSPADPAGRLRQILADPGNHKREALRPYLTESGALAYARRRAEEFAGRARAELDCLPPSACKAILEQLTERVVTRDA